MKGIRKLVIILFFIPAAGYSQQKDTLIKKLDSSGIKAVEPGNEQKNDIERAAYEGIKIDVNTYFKLLGDDFKQQVTLPFHTKGKEWLKVGGFALAAAGIALANKPINHFAVDIHNHNAGVASASKYITRFGGVYEVYALAGFFTSGLLFHTQKEKTTTVLATQAYITSVVYSTVSKYIFGEQRPYVTDPVSQRRGPIFHGPFYTFKKGPDGRKLSREDYTSFPSGHSTAAFAAATVYAMEYRDKPLVPIISYTAATAIALSRLTENKHWPLDVVMGATLGYLCGRQVVNNYHRYSKIKQPGQPPPKTVTFNFQYFNNQFVPGLIYVF